jgi:hypothetical protein
VPDRRGCAGATQLKTPYSDGATHVIFKPLDFKSHILVRHPSGDTCWANRLSCRLVIAKLVVLASIEDQPIIDKISSLGP